MKKVVNQELKARVKELEEQLGKQRISFEDWARDVPQEWRDKFAATAYFRETGHTLFALWRLGIDCSGANYKEIAQKVFFTPGCQEIINRNLSDANEAKPAIVERLVKTSLHGEDGDATRCISLLARMSGWVKEPSVNVDNRRISLYQMNGSSPEAKAIEAEVRPALAGMLDHEPGDAIRVSSDDRIDAVLEEVAPS